MKKKINLISEGFTIDGNPPQIIDGVFPCTILDYRIEPYRFKSGARGYQTVFIVKIETGEDYGKTRTITLQHPFLSESESNYVLQQRGAKWRALHDSLKLDVAETELFCTFLDGTQHDIKYAPYSISEEEKKCCKCDRTSGLSVKINNTSYSVCRDHVPEYMIDVVDTHLHQRFLIGKNTYCEIKDKDIRNNRKYPFSRFLNKKGYEYLLETQQAKDEPKAEEKIHVDMSTASVPDDDFGGDQ